MAQKPKKSKGSRRSKSEEFTNGHHRSNKRTLGSKRVRSTKKSAIRRKRMSANMKHRNTVSSETAGMHEKAIDRPSVTDAPREHAKDPSQELQEHTTEAPRENIRSKTPAGTY